MGTALLSDVVAASGESEKRSNVTKSENDLRGLDFL